MEEVLALEAASREAEVRKAPAQKRRECKNQGPDVSNLIRPRFFAE